VSLLKPAIPSTVVPQPDLPLQCAELQAGTYPIAIADHKWIQAGKSTMHLVQVQWYGMPSSWLTWENQARLQANYPNAHAWGQADFQDGGNVTTSPMTRPVT
jgi:hypothetical protein